MNEVHGFFSKQDLGGEDPEKFRLHLQIANLKQKNSSLLEALKECEDYFDNLADVDYGETHLPNREMKLLSLVRKAIQNAENQKAMRVICINDNEQYDEGPKVIKGHIYTVVGINKIGYFEDELYTYDAGDYYILAECGDDDEYLADAFIQIIENQQDETEMERNYQKETV
jgi:hypothetical protein